MSRGLRACFISQALRQVGVALQKIRNQCHPAGPGSATRPAKILQFTWIHAGEDCETQTEPLTARFFDRMGKFLRRDFLLFERRRPNHFPCGIICGTAPQTARSNARHNLAGSGRERAPVDFRIKPATLGSARRPRQRTLAEHMHVQMGNTLARIGATVNHHSVTSR